MGWNRDDEANAEREWRELDRRQKQQADTRRVSRDYFAMAKAEKQQREQPAPARDRDEGRDR